jgi:HAD superfamily hydrolase (TIGR01509 family)
MPGFDSILFDFDGVLADTEPVHCACWAEVLAPAGIALQWEFYRAHCIGIDDREMVRMLAAQAVPPLPWEDLWRLYPPKKELFRARMAAAPPFAAGLAEFLRGLAEHYTLAVVSSSACSEIEPILEAGALRRYFRTVVGGEDVRRHKPASDPYLLAAERLGAAAPLVVEDSAAGIASGHAAGFAVLAVTSPADVPDLVRRRLAV